MLKTLLNERFQLKLRSEMKQLPVYVLVIGKSGLRMKESIENPDATEGPITRDAAGFPQLPPGHSARAMMQMNGRVRISGRVQSLADVAALLERQLARPVVDKTGLTRKYDFDLDFASEANGNQGNTGVALGGSEPSQPSEPPPSLVTAVQEQLGLRLESTKDRVEILVIDHAEKPSEN